MLRPAESDHATKDGRFQSGDEPGTQATIVKAEWFNGIQDEIANVIEGRGIQLNQDQNDQLLKAIIDIYEFGVKPVTFNLENDQRTPIELGHPAFDHLKIKAAYFNAVSVRHTKKDEKVFSSTHVAVYCPNPGHWRLMTGLQPEILQSSLDENAKIEMAAHFLSIKANGVLQYQTQKLEGDDYTGTLTLSHFRYLRPASNV